MNLYENKSSLDQAVLSGTSDTHVVNITNSSEIRALEVSTREQLDALQMLQHLLKWLTDLRSVEVSVPVISTPMVILAVMYIAIVWLVLRRHANHESTEPEEDVNNNDVSELFDNLSFEVQRLEDRVTCVERARVMLGAGDHVNEYEGLDGFAKEFDKLQERLARVEEQCVKLKEEEFRRELFDDEDVETRVSFPCVVDRAEYQPSWVLEQKLEDTISQMRNESANSVALTHELHAMRNNLEVARKQRQSIVKDFKTLMTDVGLERTLTSDAIRDAVNQLKKMPYGVRALNIAVGVLETIHSHISFGQHLRLRRVASFLSKYEAKAEDDIQRAFTATF